MRTVWWISTVLHRFAVLAILLPFLAGQVLPAGVMPGRSDDGSLTLVLCTPDGPQEIEVNLGTDGTAPSAEPAACPWAVLHAMVLQPDATPGPAAPVHLTAVNHVSPNSAAAPAMPLAGPFARAPPNPA